MPPNSRKRTYALIAVVCAATGARAADETAKIQGLARDCAAGKQKACTDLSKTAVEDKRPSVRRTAVGSLTDQAILAQIALKDADAEVRGDAAAKVTDPALLAQIAIEATDNQMRTAATKKITDQTLLVKVVSESRDTDERITLVSRISDSSALAKWAFNDPDSGMRKAATDKLIQTIDAGALTSILKAKPDFVTLTDSQGNTALLWAALYGHKDVAELLLDSGALINAKSKRGATPLYAAAEGGHKDLVELLIAHKADVDARMNSGYSALHMAAEKGHKDVAELLLANNATLTAKDQSGATPLHSAASGGHADVVEFLLAKGAGVSVMDNYGETPIKYAAEQNHADVVELLRRQGGQLRTASRNLKASERNGQTFIGDVPFILSAYGPAGEGAGSLSADFSNSIIYYSDISSNLMLGVQVDARQNAATASVSLNRKTSVSAFIDSAGLVFAGELTQMDDVGPSITLEFQDANQKRVLPPTDIQVVTKSGAALRIRPEEDNLLTVENVPPEPLLIKFSKPDSPHSQSTAVLFPKFRSARAGVVIYSLQP